MKPLEKTLRVRLLWILTAIFIVGAPVLIGYSQGYRLGDAMSLINTGGIYLHADLSRTQVYLDGEFMQSRGYFSRNTFLQNLRSNKTYEVWVEREGYQSWIKELPVYPKMVTEARVLMVPNVFMWDTVEATSTPSTVEQDDALLEVTEVANPVFTELLEKFEDPQEQFVFGVASTTFVVEKGKSVATSTIVYEMTFSTWMQDVASTSELHLKQNVRERDGVVVWLDEGDVHTVWGRQQDNPPFFFCSATCTPAYVIDWEEDIERFEFYPNRNDVVILGSARGIFAVELDGRSVRNVQPIIEEKGLDFRILQNGSLVVYDGESFRRTSW